MLAVMLSWWYSIPVRLTEQSVTRDSNTLVNWIFYHFWKSITPHL